MTLYQQKQFTLPTNTKTMSKELFAYRTGLIDKIEFMRLMGYDPDAAQEGQNG